MSTISSVTNAEITHVVTDYNPKGANTNTTTTFVHPLRERTEPF